MRIMVVDDDPDVIFVLKQVLKECGCELVEVTDSEKCIDAVRKEKPEIIFLDVMMPGISGWTLCKEIKEDSETTDIFIAMLTVRCEKEDKIRSFEYAKANYHLCKPINFSEVKKIVEGLKPGRTSLKINQDFASGCFQCL